MLKKLSGQKTYKIITGISLLVMFFFMVFYNKRSFWGDELHWTIGLIDGLSFQEMLQRLYETTYNLPLFYLLLRPLYYLVPFGQVYLLLLPISCVIVGIIGLNKVGKILVGEVLAIILTLLGVSSSILICIVGWELRPYALYFALSVWVLYYFIKCKEEKNLYNILIYGILMTLFLYSHWFASIIIFFYGIIDIYSLLRKKIKIQIFLSYIIAFLAFLPWLLLVFFNHITVLNEYWARTPRLMQPLITIKFFLGNNNYLMIVFIISLIYILINWFYQILKKREEKVINYLIIIGSTIIFLFTIILVYSKYINPRGSLYVERYFLAVFPHILILICYLIYKIIFLKVPFKKYKISAVFILGILYLWLGVSNYLLSIDYGKGLFDYSTPNQLYKQAAEYLYNDELAYKENTLVINPIDDTWVRYYFIKRNHHLPTNMAYNKSIITTSYDNESLNLFVKNNKKINDEELKYDDMMKYDRIYILTGIGYYKKNYLKKFSEHYPNVQEFKESGLTIYSK